MNAKKLRNTVRIFLSQGLYLSSGLTGLRSGGTKKKSIRTNLKTAALLKYCGKEIVALIKRPKAIYDDTIRIHHFLFACLYCWVCEKKSVKPNSSVRIGSPEIK